VAKEAFFRLRKQVFVVSFDQMAWLMVICFAMASFPIIFLRKSSPITGPTDAH